MKAESTYARRLLAREALGIGIVDCHGHIGTFANQYIPREGRPEATVAMMDELGMRTACVSHCLGIGPDFRVGNRRSCEAAASHPGRLAIYLAYNPNYPAEAGLASLEELAGSPGVVGVKFHTTQHQAVASDERFAPAWEFARRRGLLILSHTWGVPDILGIEKMARRFPDVPVIMGHSGGYEFAAVAEAMRVARECDNAFLDLCLSGMFEGLVEAFVRDVDARKVLFGSDIPFIDPRANLGRVVFARIPDPDKELILRDNTRALLGRTGFRVP